MFGQCTKRAVVRGFEEELGGVVVHVCNVLGSEQYLVSLLFTAK